MSNMEIPDTDGFATPATPATHDVASHEQDERARTRLLNAAVRVFDRKGYAAASVREIAEMAGVTKPALYYHFGSKEGVFIAILDQAQRQFGQALERAMARAGSARDRIVALCEDVYGLFGENVPLARVAHAVFLGPPDGMPPYDVTVFESRFRQAIERMAADGLRAGEFRAVASRDIALAVMGILEGCNERQLVPAFESVSVEDVRRLLDLFFDGVNNTQRA
jgi:AcrR family transcriptional regulator